MSVQVKFHFQALFGMRNAHVSPFYDFDILAMSAKNTKLKNTQTARNADNWLGKGGSVDDLPCVRTRESFELGAESQTLNPKLL